ncbi:MAG: DUF4344 domain-containing metallopeptidase [Pseudomonadota bacterium]
MGSRYQALGGAVLGALFASPAAAFEWTPFIEAQLADTLFHEIGHALVQEFELPVLGQEEDAVDAFATLEILRLYEKDAADVLVDVAAGWLVLDAWTDREDLNFYGEHDLDAQRGYRIICNLYGTDPIAYEAEADWAELPEEERERCEFDGPKAFDDWETMLEPHLLPEEAAPIPARIVYGPGPSALRDAVIASGLYEWANDNSVADFDWPEPITLAAETCGEPTAYWEPDALKVVICYEMLEEWAEIEAALDEL